MTNIPIDKNNLTNFQRIFRNEKDIKQQVSQVTNEISVVNVPPTPSVFNAIHSLDVPENIASINLQRKTPLTAGFACNPLLLSITSYEQSSINASNMATCNTSSASNSLNEEGSNLNIHINQMFDGAHDQVNRILSRN
jgi:hypothetical protein